MKRKSTKKKSSSKKQNRNSVSFYSMRYIIVAAVVIILGLTGTSIFNNVSRSTNVLGTKTYLADKNDSSNDTEKPDKVEPTDIPEPTDVPEKQQAVENVQHEIDKQVEKNNVQNVEIQPPTVGSDSGKVILQQVQGTTQEIQTPTSNTTPVTQINTSQSGTVSVHIAGPNSITINNGPYAITTQYPVVINPTDQTMAIRTPSGVTIIKTFPTEIFQNIPPVNKLSSVSSLSLTDQQGTPVYQANGIQIRKLFGVFPVNGQVKEDINAQTGQVINTNLPWYFSLFGFAFKTT